MTELSFLGLAFNGSILFAMYLFIKEKYREADDSLRKAAMLEEEKQEIEEVVDNDKPIIDEHTLRKNIIHENIKRNKRGSINYDKAGLVHRDVASNSYGRGIVNEAGNVVRYKDGVGVEGMIAGKEYNQIDRDKDGRILISEVYPLTEAEVIEKILAVDSEFSKTEFKSFVKSVFMLIQKAWSNNDYLALRLLEADHLYYEHKAIIHDYIDRGIVDKREKIGIKGVLLKDFRVEGEKEILVVALTARMDRKFDETVFRSRELTEKKLNDNGGDVPYILTFIRKKGVKTNHKHNLSNSNCPNCGAIIDIKEDGICNYCNTSLVTGEVDWILVDIKNIELVEF